MTAQPAVDDVDVESETELLRAPDVTERTGATYRQLDYWTRAGHTQPADRAEDDVDPATPGSGRLRLWPAAEVEAIRRAVLVSKALPHLTNEVVFRIARSGRPVGARRRDRRHHALERVMPLTLMDEFCGFSALVACVTGQDVDR